MKHSSAAAKAAARNATATAAPESKALATIATPEAMDTTFKPFRAEFEADGETVKPFDVKAVLPQQVGEFIVERLAEASKSGNAAAWALYRAKEAGIQYYANTLIALNTGVLSDSALSNLKSVAERVIPFKLKYGVRAPLSLLKDVVAAVIEKDCSPKSTPEATAILEALKAPEVTQRALRDIRGKYDKKTGLPVQKALPAPVVAAAPVQGAGDVVPVIQATGITAEIRDDRATLAAAAADAPAPAAPPVANKSIDPAKDARDKAFASGVVLPLRTLAAFIREHSIQPDEREIVVNRLREVATLLSLTIA